MPLRELEAHNPTLIRHLLQAKLAGRVSHSYIMTGDDLEVLDQFLLAWSQVCACKQTQQDGDACGKCQTCRQLTNETYPYLYRLSPQSKSRSIVVDEVRKLERNIYLTSGGNLKVGIIYEADCMMEQAQNAFLKTLEEPASNTLLILVTVRPAGLLATIRSRCQTIALLSNRMRYKLPEAETLYAALARLGPARGSQVAIGVSEEISSILKQVREEAVANAAPRVEALKQNADQLEAAQRKQIASQCDAAVESEYRALREALLSAIHTWFSQELLRASGISTDKLPNPEMMASLSGDFAGNGGEFPPTVTPDQAIRAIDLTDELLNSLRFNVDEQLAIQDYCQKICAR